MAGSRRRRRKRRGGRKEGVNTLEEEEMEGKEGKRKGY